MPIFRRGALWTKVLTFTTGVMVSGWAGGFAAGNPVSTGLPPINFRTFPDVAQDGTGRIWASSYNESPLNFWDGKDWAKDEYLPFPHARPVTVTAVPDGNVLGLWRDQNNSRTFTLSEHFGTLVRELGRGEIDLVDNPRLWRTKLGTWITTDSGEIYHLENGSMRRVYRVDRGQMITGFDHKFDRESHHNQIWVTEDPAGRTWFWSNEFTVGYNALSMRGFLIWDGKNWDYHPRIPGLPDLPATVLVPRDAGSFWVSIGGQGLFVLDLETMRARPVKSPLPGAFADVQLIRNLGGFWYLVENLNSADPDVVDNGRPAGRLWRLTAESSPGRPPIWRWQLLVNGLDEGGDFEERPFRPLLPDGKDLWVGAMHGGVWHLSPGAPPEHIDWRRDFNLPACSDLMRQPDGRIMAVCSWKGLVSDIRPFSGRPRASSPEIFSSVCPLAEDSHYHFWRVSNLQSRKLLEWDGVRWIPHPIPSTYAVLGMETLACDPRGRVWFLPNFHDRDVLIYDAGKNNWTQYPSYAAALQHELVKLGPQGFARLQIGDGRSLYPAFRAPNRIAFRSVAGRIGYYDGKTWRFWFPAEIARDKKTDIYIGRLPVFRFRGPSERAYPRQNLASLVGRTVASHRPGF